ncbi:MAG TPA: 30S ribosomal protein S3 [Nitrososphaerales archaeon]|uniref:Small ribosomal subunit protein uS3 n=1 Tax=uncultured thaumarchaeote Rifle_16ft_4_minimus_1872 TaxID=1665209 RepID=A0A0H4T4Z8_9ARCH|nr:30S ribosomal protein S3p [uncultured thaumarchaeote Rifle_16ft_4_minimus_1872]
MSAVKNILKNYSRNIELDEYLSKHLAEAGFGGADIVRSQVGTRINVYVFKPGLVIGRRGTGIRQLTEDLEKKFGLPNPQVSVAEVSVPELNPYIMACRIAQSVGRGTAFRRAASFTLNSIMGAGAMGCEIGIAGKLRSERSHFEKYKGGVVPKSGNTAKAIVREATTDVLMKMGLYGIKVKIAVKDAIPKEFELIEKEEAKPAIEETKHGVDTDNESQ